MYYDDRDFDALVGITPIDVWVGEDEETLYLIYSDGTLALQTAGDCCSQSWWADVLGYHQLVNHRIASVTRLDLPEPKDDRTRQEYDQAYGIELRTEAGAATLVFRNSSNGYYGGWVDEIAEIERVPETARRIEGDWSA